MDIEKELQNKIKDERQMKQSRKITDIIKLLDEGNTKEVNSYLLYHVPLADFYDTFSRVFNHVKKTFDSVPVSHRKNMLYFLLDLSINLGSCLVYWHLLSKDSPLKKEDISHYQTATLGLLKELERKDAGITELLLDEISKREDTRLKVEEVPDSEMIRLIGSAVEEGLARYSRYLTEEITSSNISKLFLMRMKGETTTQIGHDYASFLDYALWRGASLVTTNPVLIKLAWDVEDERYSGIPDEILRKKDDDISEIVSELTMSVVYSNATLLRDIFLVTEGKEGYVCLQVNPENHYDTERMVSEAKTLYSILWKRFNGVPNVVFKLPGTKAGVNAARRLTQEGIGVTMTVTFSLFQLIPAACVISEGHALVSYLALMNGRLANPVIKELESIDDESLMLAGRYAGVVVGKRVESKLRQMNIEKVKLLIASLRNYDGEIPDVTELIGAGVITFFPNIRRAFDARPRLLYCDQVEKTVSHEAMNNLLKSEIFKQAYYMEGDDERIKPVKVLDLSMEEEVSQWAPVNATLTQFKDFYIQLCQRISDRAERFESGKKAKVGKA